MVALVKNELRKGPLCGTVFIFRVDPADRLKLLCWNCTGVVMKHKHLGKMTFTWSAMRDGLMSLNHAKLEALFVGLSWRARGLHQSKPGRRLRGYPIIHCF